MGGARDELRCPSLGSTPWLEGLTNKGKVFNHSTSSLPLAAHNLTATKVKNKNKFIFNLLTDTEKNLVPGVKGNVPPS